MDFFDPNLSIHRPPPPASERPSTSAANEPNWMDIAVRALRTGSPAPRWAAQLDYMYNSPLAGGDERNFWRYANLNSDLVSSAFHEDEFLSRAMRLAELQGDASTLEAHAHMWSEDISVDYDGRPFLAIAGLDLELGAAFARVAEYETMQMILGNIETLQNHVTAALGRKKPSLLSPIITSVRTRFLATVANFYFDDKMKQCTDGCQINNLPDGHQCDRWIVEEMLVPIMRRLEPLTSKIHPNSDLPLPQRPFEADAEMTRREMDIQRQRQMFGQSTANREYAHGHKVPGYVTYTYLEDHCLPQGDRQPPPGQELQRSDPSCYGEAAFQNDSEAADIPLKQFYDFNFPSDLKTPTEAGRPRAECAHCFNKFRRRAAHELTDTERIWQRAATLDRYAALQRVERLNKEAILLEEAELKAVMDVFRPRCTCTRISRFKTGVAQTFGFSR